MSKNLNEFISVEAIENIIKSLEKFEYVNNLSNECSDYLRKLFENAKNNNLKEIQIDLKEFDRDNKIFELEIKPSCCEEKIVGSNSFKYFFAYPLFLAFLYNLKIGYNIKINSQKKKKIDISLLIPFEYELTNNYINNTENFLKFLQEHFKLNINCEFNRPLAIKEMKFKNPFKVTNIERKYMNNLYVEMELNVKDITDLILIYDTYDYIYYLNGFLTYNLCMKKRVSKRKPVNAKIKMLIEFKNLYDSFTLDDVLKFEVIKMSIKQGKYKYDITPRIHFTIGANDWRLKYSHYDRYTYLSSDSLEEVLKSLHFSGNGVKETAKEIVNKVKQFLIDNGFDLGKIKKTKPEVGDEIFSKNDMEFYAKIISIKGNKVCVGHENEDCQKINFSKWKWDTNEEVWIVPNWTFPNIT